MFALRTSPEEIARTHDLLEGYLDIDEVNSSEEQIASTEIL